MNQPSTIRQSVPGESGAWVLYLGDMSVFALFLATYSYYKQASPDAFAEAQSFLSRDTGCLNTFVLLLSSLTMLITVDNLKRGLLVPARLFTVITILFGMVFIGIKVHEYSLLLSKVEEAIRVEFFTYYFMLTGLHLLHILVGMGLLISLLWHISARMSSVVDTRFVEVTACYWHMVDLLWLIIFPLLYLT